jgi:hypothetical protein
LQDVEDVFGSRVDVEKVKRVPLMASVGSEDTTSSAAAARRLLKGEGFGSKN